jgi:hypothetical protein
MPIRWMFRAVLIVFFMAWIGIPISSAEESRRVGVMRSTIPISGSRMEAQQAQMMAQMPARLRGGKYAAQMAEMQNAMASSAVNLQETVGKQLPGLIQRNWVEMLQLKGIPAVALDASTIEEARVEAKIKNVGWILNAESRPEKKQDSVKVGNREFQGSSAKLQLSVRYSVEDASGRTLLPWKSIVKEIDVAPGSSEDQSTGDDIWALVGSELVHGVESTLPLGVVKYQDPDKNLPAAPDMGSSLRLDMTSTSKQFYKGKLIPHSIREGQKKSIFEFADKSLTMEYKKAGLIATAGSPILYMVNDDQRWYCRMAMEDFEFETILMGGHTGTSPGHLEHRETNGDTVTYNYVADEPGNTTTVEVQYGLASPAWQQGMVTMKAFKAGKDAGPTAFGDITDPELAKAVWEELANSAAFPVHVLIKQDSLVPGKKNADYHSEYETTVDTSQLPRPVDFTIPKTYKWHSNMMLNMAWVL